MVGKKDKRKGADGTRPGKGWWPAHLTPASLLESMPDGAIILDTEGMVCIANRAAALMLGCELQELVGKPPDTIIASRAADLGSGGELWNLAGQGALRGIELELRARSRRVIPVEADGWLVRAEDGGAVAMVMVLRDARKGAQIQQAAYFTAIVESSDDAIFAKTTEGVITNWGRGAQLLYGYSAAEAVGRSVRMLVPPQRQDELTGVLRRVSQGEHVRGFETQRIRKDGKPLAISLTVSPVKDASGRIIGASTIARDITERKQAEEQLAHHNRVLRAIRNVNQLIAREKDRAKLLQGTCECLVETRGYRNCWIALAQNDGRYLKVAAAGMAEGFWPVGRSLEPEQLPACIGQLLAKGRLHIVEDHTGTCRDCANLPRHRELTIASARLEYGGTLFGLLSLSLPRELADDDEELGLIQELTNDLSFGLHALQTEELRQQAIEQLERAKLAAEAANEAKSRFLTNMSHELRTPLNSIIGFSEILTDQTFGQLNRRQARYLGYILQSGRHLLDLINDILDLSRVEAGKMELEFSSVNVRRLLENSILLFREEALKHYLSLDVTVSDELSESEIIADERKLRQVVFNLLSNATKYTRDGGKISLEAKRKGGDLVVSVSDTGPGVKPEYKERIFAEFEQGERPYRKASEGSGLGLALSRKLVELHGGRIWVESEGEGKGSTFKFTVPLRRA